MALSLSRAFGAMGSEASKFDRRKTVADPELGLMSQEGSRGSDVRRTTGQLTAPTKVRFQHINVGWWEWRELFGFDFLRVRI